MEEISWEKSANGLSAKFLHDRPVRSELYSRAMMVAFSKLKDVCDISASFNGQKVFFEPYIDVFIQSQATAEFLSVYQAGIAYDQSEEQDSVLPRTVSSWSTSCTL